MDYKVLYRKYRPNNFTELVGQKNTLKILKESIINEKISHAYIFSGPRGTGKTSMAKIFAKAINCLCCKDGNPCEVCDNCKNFLHNSDIYEIDAASNNGVDQIREIIDNIKLSPISSKYKVYIIDEVHMLSVSAFNALLLTLEEPPAHAIFILATTNIENVPITVLSRCQRMDFKKISDEDIFERLKEISEKENIDITDGAISEIAFCADGGLRDALSILDQLSKENQKIDADLVLSSIGVISTKSILDLINAIENSDVNTIVDFVNNARGLSLDYKSIIKRLIEQLKNRCIEIKLGNIISQLGYSKIKDLCFDLANTIYKANVNIDSFSLLELILLDYVNLSSDVSLGNNEITPEIKLGNINNAKKESNDVESEFKEKVVIENEKPIIKEESKIQDEYEKKLEENPLVKIRINNCFISASKNYLNEVIDKWQSFIDSIKNKKIKGLLLDAVPALASDEIIVLKTEFKENSGLINKNVDAITDAFDKFDNNQYKFIAVDYKSWDEEMNNYKYNIKNGIKYEYIDELIANTEQCSIVENIFGKDKIEIE